MRKARVQLRRENASGCLKNESHDKKRRAPRFRRSRERELNFR
jgi:hypothetical protein